VELAQCCLQVGGCLCRLELRLQRGHVLLHLPARQASA
jgi:hypothetical protein